LATIFTHAIVAGSLTQVGPNLDKRKKIRLLFLLLFVALIPDADVISFALGIPYQHFLGHRGFSHSILFAVILALPCALFVFNRTEYFSSSWWWVYLLLVLAGISHGVLDAMTDAGLGVGFFIPFDLNRYFFDWRPIKTSPIGIARFFTYKAWLILQSELIFIWLPVLLSAFVIRIGRRIFSKKV